MGAARAPTSQSIARALHYVAVSESRPAGGHAAGRGEHGQRRCSGSTAAALWHLWTLEAAAFCPIAKSDLQPPAAMTSLCRVATCNLNQWAMDFEGNLRRIEASIGTYPAHAVACCCRTSQLRIPAAAHPAARHLLIPRESVSCRRGEGRRLPISHWAGA